MPKRQMQALKRVVESPRVNILASLILLATAAAEVVSELIEIEEISVGAHHGVLLFAILHLLKSLPDVFEELEHLQKASEPQP